MRVKETREISSNNPLIFKEVKIAFLKKDGTPFKREKKRFWVKNLVNIIAENLNIKPEIAEKGVRKLIDDSYLVKDYKSEVYYKPEFRLFGESMKALKGIDYEEEKENE